MVMQTDFGSGGGCAMRGVIKTLDPEVDVFDANHTIDKFNVRQASRNLNGMVAYWPSGTVFVSVVDPGVGTSRRACCALLKNGSYVITPDNGTLTILLENPGIEAVRVIDETRNRLRGTEKVSIFHGRDLFAYCAGKLASGIINFEGVGEAYPVSEIVRYREYGYEVSPGKVKGYAADMMRNFGNLESTIPIEAAEQAGFAPGEQVILTIMYGDTCVFRQPIAYRLSFGWVAEGEDVVYNSSDGVIGIGTNRGNFVDRHHIGFGEDWQIIMEKESV